MLLIMEDCHVLKGLLTIYHHPRISKLGICGPVMAIVLTDSKLETYPSRLYRQSVAGSVYMTVHVDEKMTVKEKLS